MSEQTSGQAPAARLWTSKGFKEDGWRHAEGVEDLGEGRSILPLAVALRQDETWWAGRNRQIGVTVQPGEPIDPLLTRLDGIALVELTFPVFSDGRSYSKAELLRRHGYRGIIRAAGQVLVDQLPLMLRVGFDEFSITNPVLLDRLEKGEVGGIDLAYQPAAAGADRPDAGLGSAYSWRRVTKT